MAITCRNCGLPLNAGDAFCGNCGQAATPDDPTTVLPAAGPRSDGRAEFLPLPTDDARPARVPAGSPAPADTADQPAGPAEPPAEAELYVVPGQVRQSITDIVGEPSFDPVRNKRFLWQVARRFALLALFYLVLLFAVFTIGLILSLIGGFALAVLIQVASVLVGIAVLICFVVMPVPALLAYGSKIVSGRGASAPRAFEAIGEALDRHATPRDSLQARPLSLPGEDRRQYLELRRGAFAGYVSCFPHGRDLYFSWTFWIYMSPYRLAVMRIGRIFQNLQGRGNDLHQSLRYESVRATVGALQICTVEGVEVAISEADRGEPFSLPGGLTVPIS